MVVCAAVSAPQPKWMEEVVVGYAKDPYTKDIVTRLSLDGTSVPNFSWI
jgi:hypothetical protein